jgi:hypothetical protein
VCSQGAAFASKVAVKCGTKLLAKQATRLTNPSVLLADGIQLVTELVVMNKVGASPESAKTVGRGVGCVSSVAIGAAVGGPIGAGVGFGLWLFGEAIGELFS